MKDQRLLILLLLLAITVMFANIGGLDVYALDEAKNAEAAREMWESGNYVVPYYNYELRTDKPPLHYYFMAAGYSIFGPNAFGARFFGSVMGVLTVMIVFLFAKKHFDRRTGLFSSLVLLSSLHLAMQFHMSVPDPYLIFFLTWAFFSFYEAYSGNSKWALISFYFAIGCGLLIKGPIALGLTGLSALLFLLFRRDFKWKTIWRLQPFLGVPFSLAIAFPWYWAVHRQTEGVWTDEFFFKHNFSRFSDAMEGHQGIFLLTFAYVFVLGMLAVSPFVVQSILNALKQRKNPAILYILICAFTIIGFFAVSSTKLPNYTVPAYPLIAILIGAYLAKIDENWLASKGNRIGLIIYSVILIGFPVGIYFGIKQDRTISDLTYLFWYFLPFSVVGLLFLWSMIKKKLSIILIANFSVWIIFSTLFFIFLFPKVDAESPVSKTLPQMDIAKPIVSYQRLNAAFVFELQREIKRYGELEALKEFIESEPQGYVISRKRLQEELEGIGLVYVTEARDTFENPTTLIMRWGDD